MCYGQHGCSGAPNAGTPFPLLSVQGNPSSLVRGFCCHLHLYRLLVSVPHPHLKVSIPCVVTPVVNGKATAHCGPCYASIPRARAHQLDAISRPTHRLTDQFQFNSFLVLDTRRPRETCPISPGSTRGSELRSPKRIRYLGSHSAGPINSTLTSSVPSGT